LHDWLSVNDVVEGVFLVGAKMKECSYAIQDAVDLCDCDGDVMGVTFYF